jgi:Fic/DOC family
MGACFSRVGGRSAAAPLPSDAGLGPPEPALPRPAGRRSGQLGGPGSLSAAPHRTPAGSGAHRPRAGTPPRSASSIPPGHATAAAGSPGSRASSSSPANSGPAATRPGTGDAAISSAVNAMTGNYVKICNEAGGTFGKKENDLFIQATHSDLGKFASSSGLSIEAAAKVLSEKIIETAEKPLRGPANDSAIAARQGIVCRQNTQLLALHSISQSHHELTELNESLASHPRFKGLKSSDAWRMLMDCGATDKNRSEFFFENEPGYMAGMYRGLNLMLKADLEGQNLDADSLVNLHSAALQGVMSRASWSDMVYGSNDSEKTAAATNSSAAAQSSAESILKYSGFRADGAMFGLKSPQTLTRQGFSDIVEESARDSSTYRIVSTNSGAPPDSTSLPSITDKSKFNTDTVYYIMEKNGNERHTANALRSRVENIISEHKRNITSAASDDDRLRAIATCCAELERTHPFADGNARTIGFLVVNKLLLESGLSPTMIENPNRFDGFSADELAQEIKKGQEEFRKLANPAAPH